MKTAPEFYSKTKGDYTLTIRRNSQGRLVVEATMEPGIREFLLGMGETGLFHLTKRLVDAIVPITTAARRNQQFPVNSVIRMRATNVPKTKIHYPGP